jgi:hypothetical protein
MKARLKAISRDNDGAMTIAATTLSIMTLSIMAISILTSISINNKAYWHSFEK